MKNKFKLLFILIVLALVAAISIACGDAYKPNPYTGFNGYDPDAAIEIDDYVRLDGVLDEVIWSNNSTAIDIEGATRDQMSNTAVDVNTYGERNATVYTYIGEKAVYWAFEVEDKNLYFNFYRAQGSNTGVEIYFANANQATFTKGCYSVRVNPTGNGNETYIGMYQPKYLDGVVSRVETSTENGGNTWIEMTNMRGKVAAAATVDGTIMSAANQNISKEDNVGYVVEIAVDKALLGDIEADDLIYTAAFCQARDFTRTRLNNSFISGTSYIAPNTWKLVTNDGYVDDKYSYWDANVETDSNVVIDGKLDDELWANAEGRTFVSNEVKRSLDFGETELVEYTTKAVTTDKGVYIGLESNDGKIYYYENANNYYSTGAEVMVTVGGDEIINEKTTRQIRFMVGGKGKRYYGKLLQNDEYAYTEHYFAAKTAGYVINGEVGSDGADGWSGEIFIPWSSFDMTGNENRNTVAVLTNGYYAYEFDGEPTDRKYVTPVSSVVFGKGGSLVNPQRDWFVFKDGMPVYNFSVQDVLLDNASLSGGYYETEVTASFTDSVATAAKEIFPIANGGSFGFDESLGVQVTDHNNGKYTLRIPEASADAFTDETRVSFSIGARTQSISVVIDDEFVIDGVLSEDLWNYLNKLNTSQSSGLTSSTSFTVALREQAMYVSATIQDSYFDQFRDSSALGLELYINTSGELSAATTRQIRIVSNSSAATVYEYLDNGSEWPWSTPVATGKIRFDFASNNAGGYSVEARIPYSVLGLDDMPYSIEVAPFTKFVKDANNGAVSTKLVSWEGNEWTRNHALYQNFDSELGYAPNKVVITSSIGDEADGIEIIKGLQLGASGNYEGEIALSIFPESEHIVTDAKFGSFNSYFTHVGNGKYRYSIPQEVLTQAKTTIEVSSIEKTLRTSFDVVCETLSKMYFNADGANLYAVDRSGSDYVFRLKVTADERGLIPIEGVTFESGWTSVDNGNGMYTLTVPAATIEASDSHVVTASVTLLEDSIEQDITFKYVAWSEDELNNVLTYVNFNNSINDVTGNSTVTPGAGSSVVYVDGTGFEGVELRNPDSGNPVKQTVNIARSLGVGDFTISFDFKLDIAAIGVFATGAQYEMISSGSSVDTGADTFQISAVDNQKKSTGFRIQMGTYGGDARYNTYNFYELGILSEHWYNFTLVVDRNYAGTTNTAEKISVSLYINGEFQKTQIMSIEPGQVLGDGEINLGGDYWAYDGGERLLQMDNFLLYNGLLSQKQISDVAVRATCIK